MRRSDYTCIARGSRVDGPAVAHGPRTCQLEEAEEEAWARQASSEASGGIAPSAADARTERPIAAWQALLQTARDGPEHHFLLPQATPRGAARCSRPFVAASASLGLAACATLLCWRTSAVHPSQRWRRVGQATLSAAQAEVTSAADCNCEWASVSTCGQDDGGPCFDTCCHKMVNRTCKARNGCACDCSWANQSSCNYDDGGCCFTCCCGAAFVGAGTGGPKCALTELSDARPSSKVKYHPGSIYCWSLMLPTGYEKSLISAQYKRKTSIFACDEAAVYSNKKIKIAKHFYTNVVKVDLTCENGGEFKTALNNDIFLTVWQQVISDGNFDNHNWTVKVDPDTVFMPWRLRDILKDHPAGPKGVYLNNCQYGLHGPLEVFSRGAVQAWGKGQKNCSKYFADLCSGDCYWGEDMFIDQCLCKVLGVRRDDSPKLLVEKHCDPPKGWESCNDTESVAFHPFKEEKKWLECMSTASKLAPPPPTTTTSTTVTTSSTTTTATTTTTTTVTTSTTSTSTTNTITYTNTSTTSTTTATVSFDCNASVAHWRVEWSRAKMQWCCHRFGLGCLTEDDAVAFATDCNVTENWKVDWPHNKKLFCCTHIGLCDNGPEPTFTNTSTTTVWTLPPTPAAELAKGCDATCTIPSGELVVCSDFIRRLASSQFSQQQSPCTEAMVDVLTKCPTCQGCSLAKANCDTTMFISPLTAVSPSPSVETPAPHSNALQSAAKALATGTQQTASPSSTTAVAPTPGVQEHTYDCEAGFFNWKKGWSVGKMDWCCKREGKGCRSLLAPAPDEFDCDEDLLRWRTSWSPKKQTWCCTFKDKGCHQAGEDVEST